MAIISKYVSSASGMYPNGTAAYRRVAYQRIQTGFVDRYLPLPYQLSVWKFNSQTPLGNSKHIDANSVVWGAVANVYNDAQTDLQNWSTEGKMAYNRAYSKFMALYKEGAADLGALLLERASALSMVDDRLRQILKVANAAQSRSVRKLAKSLGTTPRDLRRRHRKSTGFLSTPSSTFLEVKWGWAPMMQDIFNALAYLGKDIPPLMLTGSGGYEIDKEQKLGSPGAGNSRYKAMGSFRVKVGAYLTPRSALQTELARLGLTNPGSSVYQALPYSWLVDWFSSVGEVVEGWDDSLTVKVERPFYTSYIRGVEIHRYEDWYGGRIWGGWDYVRAQVHLRRFTPPSIPGPQLMFFPPSVTLGRTGIVAALLVSKLKRFERLSKTLF